MANNSSVSSNLSIQQQNINNKLTRYINIKNAVKILENFSNWNGYIKLYTEVESNFEIDDIVYIIFTNPFSTFTFNLENPNTPYEKWSNGYKVLYVNKSRNEVVINRDYNDITSGLYLKNQYLSKVKIRGGTFKNGTIDGLTFFNSNIGSGATFTQGIFYNCEINNINLLDKYDDVKVLYSTDNYNSKFIQKKSKTATIFKKERYYYNNVINSYIYNCNVENGNFINCNFISNGTNYINDGKFDDCTFSGYTINGGRYHDCVIESGTTWNYGYWDNISGITAFNTNWINGVWVTGTFYDNLWVNGIFSSGIFSASTWMDGEVYTGDFYYTNWYGGLVKNANFYNSFWSGGTFNDGIFENSTWYDGYFNGGIFKGSIFSGGTIKGGSITGSTLYDFNVYDGDLKDSSIYNGSLYNDYQINDCDINNANIHQGTINNSDITNSNIYNGVLLYVNITSGVSYNGQYKYSDLTDFVVQNGNFEKCDADNVTFYNGIFTDGNYENGYWYGGIWNGLNMDIGVFSSDIFYGGDFYGGLFTGDTKPNPNALWCGGTFHYGYWNGVYIDIYPENPFQKQLHTQTPPGIL